MALGDLGQGRPIDVLGAGPGDRAAGTSEIHAHEAATLGAHALAEAAERQGISLADLVRESVELAILRGSSR